jgi:hypothetical protein
VKRGFYMTVEWNTRRMMVMSKSTKGKNDRIALAATEKANVCTSVRNKYFTVDSTSPKREFCASEVTGADLAGPKGGGKLTFCSHAIK